ncbi:MAG: hypothetical protein A3D92_07100 [Bacteroidetes bacterium RIFCSPHIGHO2_02_FULL_44_7]|nr:MAG: hypothetical protein A3D92_07100 [Bacteroidetes bacterium RIFCSPHIGHO2_02_FULL_44_7]
MEKAEISIHAELVLLIEDVRNSKDRQEMELKVSFKEFAHTLSPIEVAKSSIHGLVNDKGVQFDLVKGGLNLGVDFLINKFFNKNSSIKGFLGTMALEKVSSSFIQANAASMIVGITTFFSKKQEEKDENDPQENE